MPLTSTTADAGSPVGSTEASQLSVSFGSQSIFCPLFFPYRSVVMFCRALFVQHRLNVALVLCLHKMRYRRRQVVPIGAASSCCDLLGDLEPIFSGSGDRIEFISFAIPLLAVLISVNFRNERV